MVAWKMTLYSPEYPEGRYIVVIANDITCNIGSFGPEEDVLYQRASQLARREVRYSVVDQIVTEEQLLTCFTIHLIKAFRHCFELSFNLCFIRDLKPL